MPADTHPSDAIVGELVGIFRRSSSRLALIVSAGLRRGLDPTRVGRQNQARGDASLAYRARQLELAQSILAELRRDAGKAAPLVIGHAFRAGAVAVDRAVGDELNLAGSFGGIHVRAVEALAQNMTRSLEAAVDRAGDNVATVFERADRLERGLPVDGVRGVPFLGRRVDDPWRRAGLEQVAQGIVAQDTRRQVTASLMDRLVREGVTDAVTGYVARNGARIPLEHYAAGVARTTTREAMSRGTVNRMQEGGLDLVTISSHPHKSDECDPYDGGTFSLSGDTPGYDVLDQMPPFHPFCLHVVGPAMANLDRFERELTDAATARAPAAAAAIPSSATPPPPPRAPAPAPTPPANPPFGAAAAAQRDAGSLERQAAQRAAYSINADPGPEAGSSAAWESHVKRLDQQRSKALDVSLGPELAHYIDHAWGKRAGVRRRLLEGDLSIEDAEQLAYEESERVEHNRVMREVDRERDYGYNKGQVNCFICGRFKRRPADVCDYCGDDPVSHGGSAEEFNREHGSAPV